MSRTTFLGFGRLISEGTEKTQWQSYKFRTEKAQQALA